MRKTLLLCALGGAILMGAWACSHQKAVTMVAPELSSPMPRALIYKTNGNYADNVPVNLDASAGRIISYPAPSDVKNATPVAVAEGYLLDRRGVGASTVFTRYTYSQYATLAQAPSLPVLMDSIIKGSAVVELVELPMTTAEATGDTAQVNRLIREGLPGCKILLSRRVLRMD